MSDWWDDFSNNLATDLGPLVSLFGAAPTKQYLSECLTVTDVIIFATCPLGILTAVVSVIRVYGSPSLRAFVGRAQEGGGNAEAELCSSTSRDVCEIFIENGEIAPVLGRPEILKFVHDSETRDEDFYPDGVVAGIFFPQEYFDQRHGNFCPQWKEVNVTEQPVDEEDPSNEFVNGLPDIKFAPNPNLSLNVGIKPRSQFWFVSAAILRVLLQSFVLAWAILTRYSLGLLRGGSRGVYSVPLTIIGTVLLCNGMALCATLIERSTQIRVFRRTKSKQKARLYWVQPASQVICDQVFDSFCYTHSKEAPLITDTTSWKRTNDTHIFFVWIAVSTTMFGFAMQFLGLRACHSSVAVVQLAVVLVMSLVRAGLRTERLNKKENFMARGADLSEGFELDRLALRIAVVSKEMQESFWFCVWTSPPQNELEIIQGDLNWMGWAFSCGNQSLCLQEASCTIDWSSLFDYHAEQLLR